MRDIGVVRATVAPLLVLILATAALGCGSSSASRSTHASEPLMKDGLPVPKWKGIVPGYLTIHIVMARLPHLGTVLVDGQGHTFYAFDQDRARKVACTGACSLVWRPFTVRAVQALDMNPLLDSKLVGADLNPKGAHVVTFGGWPLYTYTGDTRAGTANGEGRYSYGGYWYAISLSGTLVKKPS